MKNKISKIWGIGLSAGLIFGLIGAVLAAPAVADMMQWGIVNTPSHEDFEILPNSDILDYAIDGDDGNTVYAVTGQPVTSAGEIFEYNGGVVTVPSGETEAGRSVAELFIPVIGDAAGFIEQRNLHLLLGQAAGSEQQPRGQLFEHVQCLGIGTVYIGVQQPGHDFMEGVVGCPDHFTGIDQVKKRFGVGR